MFPKVEDISTKPIFINAEALYNSLSGSLNYRHITPVIWQRDYKYENIFYRVTLKVFAIVVKDIFGNYDIVKPEVNSSSNYRYRYIMEFIIIEPTSDILESYNVLAVEIEDQEENFGIHSIDPILRNESIIDVEDLRDAMIKGEEFIKLVHSTLSSTDEKLVKYLKNLERKYKESKALIENMKR